MCKVFTVVPNREYKDICFSYRAVNLYEQHEATRHREGLVNLNPTCEPLQTELSTGKFTILVS